MVIVSLFNSRKCVRNKYLWLFRKQKMRVGFQLNLQGQHNLDIKTRIGNYEEKIRGQPQSWTQITKFLISANQTICKNDTIWHISWVCYNDEMLTLENQIRIYHINRIKGRSCVRMFLEKQLIQVSICLWLKYIFWQTKNRKEFFS